MARWAIASIISFVLTAIMLAGFLILAMIVLNGYPSMQAAMPIYLLCNCLVWPVMVGATTAVTWGSFNLASKKLPFWHLALLNSAIVTFCLLLIGIIVYFL